MPEVKQGESRNDYVSKCVPVCMKEGLTQKQAVVKCEGIFTHNKRKGIVKALRE